MMPVLRSLGLGLLVALAAFAEESVSCRVLFLDGPDDAPDTLHLFDGSSFHEVEAPRMNFSQVYQLPAGPRGLRLFGERPEDLESLPEGAPSGRILRGMKDIYLLLMSDPENQVAPVRVEVIDASQERIRMGQILWFNLTKTTIVGKVGSRKLRLGPMKRTLMKAPEGKPGDYGINLEYRRAGVKDRFPLCETKWRHDPRARSVAFVIPPKRGRTPRVLVFPDYREPNDD